MELGPYTLQVFTSLVLIVGAAFVALICDYLKGNNEQLRELMLELRVRREEEHRRVELLLSPAVAGAAAASYQREAPAADSSLEKAVPAPRSLAIPKERKRSASPEALAAMERGAQRADAHSKPRRRRPVEEEPAAASQAESLVAEVFGTRAEQLAAPESRSASKPQLVETPDSKSAEPQRIPEQVLVQALAAASQSAVASATPKPAAKKDWGSLLEATRKVPKRPAEESPLLAAVVEATTSDLSKPAQSGLPAGLQPAFVLKDLLERREPVSGLVMAVGVSMPSEAQGALAERLAGLIRSLLGPGDFAVQSKPDEFLLVFPAERGAAAQRRLSQAAQRLWDFQLHALGTYSVLFSWGGLEVRNEPMDEAISAATERMLETKRNRKSSIPEAAPVQEALREAV
jgi:hypothetical protein